MRFTKLQLQFALTYVLAMSSFRLHAWQADNGNGTFTNPLFYDEFSDPDLIRVGDDFYLTGTMMHTMPGLPVLHSKDLNCLATRSTSWTRRRACSQLG